MKRPPRRIPPLRATIMSFFGISLLLLTVLISALISFIVYQIEGTIWQERRLDAVGNAANTVSAFLNGIEKSMSFSVNELTQNEHDLPVMKSLLNSDPAFYEIIQVNEQGRILNSVSHGNKVLANSFAVRQSNWFTQVKHSATYLGPVEYASDDNPYVIIAVASPNHQILAARVAMVVLSQLVDEIHLGNSGRIFVVDQSGYIVAHPDHHMTEDYQTVATNPALSGALTDSNETWQNHYRNLEGSDVLGTAKRIGNTGWTVFAEVDITEAYQNSRNTWLILLAVIILMGSGVTLSTARMFDRWIFLPINNLRSGAGEIQSGNLNARVRIFRQDEIGAVAHSFNTMADSLQARELDLLLQSDLLRQEVRNRLAAQQALEQLNQQLEQRVAQRTLELSQANTRLKESESQFHDLVENVPAVTYQADITDDGPRVIYVSPQIGDLTGFSPREWQEEGVWIAQIHAEDFPVLEKYYEQMRATADHYSLEYRLNTRTGKTVWIRDQGVVRSRSSGSRYIQGVFSDISLERERNEILVRQALHDSLTGLPNRNLFLERLGHIMARAERQPEPRFAVLFLDMDGFKKANDRYGHARGDQVLVEVGRRIQTCLRGFDTVARFGGDEFVILVEDLKDMATIPQLEQRIQAEIQKPFVVAGEELLLSVSIGVAYSSEGYPTPEEMINAADWRMYHVKMQRKDD
jgi:diguanylate cyclase (GGDEF)-like protein/PAS domain S-box-containing protein